MSMGLLRAPAGLHAGVGVGGLGAAGRAQRHGLWQQWGRRQAAARGYRPIVAAWTKQTLQDHFFKEAKVGRAAALSVRRAHARVALAFPSCGAAGRVPVCTGLRAREACVHMGKPRPRLLQLICGAAALRRPTARLWIAEAGLCVARGLQAAGDPEEAQSHTAGCAAAHISSALFRVDFTYVRKSPATAGCRRRRATRRAPRRAAPRAARMRPVGRAAHPSPRRSPGAKVLDLGCVPGAWLQVACQQLGPRDRGGLVLGLDLQEVKLPPRWARRRVRTQGRRRAPGRATCAFVLAGGVERLGAASKRCLQGAVNTASVRTALLRRARRALQCAPARREVRRSAIDKLGPASSCARRPQGTATIASR